MVSVGMHIKQLCVVTFVQHTPPKMFLSFLCIEREATSQNSLPYSSVMTVPHAGDLMYTKIHLSKTLSIRNSFQGRPWQHFSLSSEQRFVLGLNFWEQMNMATVNFLKLCCLASKWNATTVKPFTYNSRFYGLRNFKADDYVNISLPAKELDLLYNIDSLNSVLYRHRIPQLVNYNDFLHHSVRNLTVLHFIAEREVREVPVMEGWVKEELPRLFQYDNVVDCSRLLRAYATKLLTALTAETEHVGVKSFQFGKYYCVNMSQMTSPQEIARKAGLKRFGNFSVVVVNWRGMTNQTMISSARGLHLNNRVLMQDSCHYELPPTFDNIVAHSDVVLRAVQQHMEHLNLDRFTAVHFRSEKMGTRSPRFPGSFERCFLEALGIRDRILRSRINLTAITLVDYGPYSSDTCKKCRGSTEMRRLLRKWHVKPLPHFDPTVTGASEDSGFAAAVEMELLVHGEYLILCGGGAFQSQAALRFLKRNPKDGRQRLFRVCLDDPSVQRVMRTG